MSLMQKAIAIVICIVQFVMLWNAADELSPNPDEFAHLVAGISYWRTGEASLYNVNPPLVRLVAALPCVLRGVRVPELDLKVDRTTRREFAFGERFIEENPQAAFSHLVIARRACLVFVVSGTVAVILLAGLLINNQAGLVAGWIWAFNPITLGYSIQLGCDIPGASVGAWALLSSALAIEKPTRKNVFIAGICLGLAIATKSTWIVATTLWPIGFIAIWGYVRISGSNKRFTKFSNLKLAQLVGIVSWILFLAIGVIFLAYRGHGILTQLEDYTFVSASLSGSTPVGNRFRGTWAGAVPIPFPRSFVEGIDQQWEDFDRPRWAFLFGKWKLGGWWWYYIAALFVKMPIGWILLLLASMRHASKDPRLIAIGICLPVFFIAIVSLKINMNEHSRYVWQVLPMLAVIASTSVAYSSTTFWKMTSLSLVAWIVGAGLLTFPFGIAYSNELFGGPSRISTHLASSNVDWSQGWVAARKWLSSDRNRDRSIGIVSPAWYPLSVIGIETIDDDPLTEESTFAPDVPILVLVCIHDRMEIERSNRNAFSIARKIKTIAYCVEVYEFPFVERFRLHGTKQYHDLKWHRFNN